MWRTYRLIAKDAKDFRRGTQRISLCVPLRCPLRSSAFESSRKENKTRKNGKGLRVLHRAHKFHQRILRVAVEHSGIGFEEQRILESRETLALTALEHDYRLRMVYFQDRHAGDRTVGVVASVRIHH